MAGNRREQVLRHRERRKEKKMLGSSTGLGLPLLLRCERKIKRKVREHCRIGPIAPMQGKPPPAAAVWNKQLLTLFSSPQNNVQGTGRLILFLAGPVLGEKAKKLPLKGPPPASSPITDLKVR